MQAAEAAAGVQAMKPHSLRSLLAAIDSETSKVDCGNCCFAAVL